MKPVAFIVKAEKFNIPGLERGDYNGYVAVPENHKYFAYRFIPNIGILDDINGPDMSVSNIYSDKYHGKEPTDTRVKKSVLGDTITVSNDTVVG